MLLTQELSIYAIARELNRTTVEYIGGSKWDYQAVYAVLTSPKYAGCHVFGRTSSKLSTPTVSLPRSEWVLMPGAFEPIVDPATFSEAQRILHERTVNKSDEELLDSLRALLGSKGRLSLELIKNSAGVPSPSTYRHRFGSLRRAYELIQYGRPEQFGPIDLRRKTQALRGELIAKIVAMFPGRGVDCPARGRWKPRLRLRSGLMVSVLIGRSVWTWKNTMRWRIGPVPHEWGLRNSAGAAG